MSFDESTGEALKAFNDEKEKKGNAPNIKLDGCATIILFFVICGFLSHMVFLITSANANANIILNSKEISCVFDDGGSSVSNISQIEINDGYIRFHHFGGNTLSTGYKLEDVYDLSCVIVDMK